MHESRQMLREVRQGTTESARVLFKSVTRCLEGYFKVDSECCDDIGGQPIPDSGFQIAD